MNFLINILLDALLVILYWLMLATYAAMGLFVGAVLGACILVTVPLIFVRAVHTRWREP